METARPETSLVGLGFFGLRAVDLQDARCAAKHAAMVARRGSGVRVPPAPRGAVMHVELAGPTGRCSVPSRFRRCGCRGVCSSLELGVAGPIDREREHAGTRPNQRKARIDAALGQGRRHLSPSGTSRQKQDIARCS